MTLQIASKLLRELLNLEREAEKMRVLQAKEEQLISERQLKELVKNKVKDHERYS